MFLIALSASHHLRAFCAFAILCQGGLLGHDGSIYGIPYNAEKVLKTLGIDYCSRLAIPKNQVNYYVIYCNSIM